MTAPDRRGAIGRRHPLAKLAAAVILMLAVFVTLDGLTAAIVLAVLVAAAPAAGVAPARLAQRAWPLLLAAAGIGLLNALLAADPAGETLWSLGPLRLTTGSAVVGFSLAIRLMAIALTAVIAVARLDPTELADALVQQLHLPARFAVGALGAIRMAPIFRLEWERIGRARRARGVEPGGSPVAAVALLAGRSHALLAGGIRRGLRLANAMDARGLGALTCRTFARDRPMQASDWSLLVGSFAIAVAATTISVAVGTWRFLLR